MRRWFLFFFLVLYSFSANANIICIGNNSCQILDDAAKKSNLSINNILNELSDGIIIPIIQNQSSISIINISKTSFSLNGVDEDNYRFGINITSTWLKQDIKSNILGLPFNGTYIFGGSKPTLFLEIPNDNKYFNTILNVSYWDGPIDYGTKITDNIFLKESTFSISERYFFIKNKTFDLSIISGILLGNRKLNLSEEGTNFTVRTNYGLIGWSGQETFDQNTTLIGVPSYLINSIKLYNFTLSGLLQYNIVYSNDIYKITKNGKIGPFLGETGYFNTGIESNESIKKFHIFPDYGVSLEYKILNIFFSGFYHTNNLKTTTLSFNIGLSI